MKEEIIIQLKKKSSQLAEILNELWRKFADEEEEKNYKTNYEAEKQGHSLHFTTESDILKTCTLLRGHELETIENNISKAARFYKDKSRENEYYANLGFRPDMSDKEAIEKYKEALIESCKNEIGVCRLELSERLVDLSAPIPQGDWPIYCWHILVKIKKFLELPEIKELVKWRDKKDLERYIQQRDKIITYRYCKVCKQLALKLGVKLPILESDNISFSEIIDKVLTIDE